MENSKQPIHPMVNSAGYPGFLGTLIDRTNLSTGLTKREYAAVMAMQGMLAYNHRPDAQGWTDIAHDAVLAADELLKQLEK